jgi:hypothetical protein
MNTEQIITQVTNESKRIGLIRDVTTLDLPFAEYGALMRVVCDIFDRVVKLIDDAEEFGLIDTDQKQMLESVLEKSFNQQSKTKFN